MEKQEIQSNMLGRRVSHGEWQYQAPNKTVEGIVVAVWTKTIVEGRDYPYRDGSARNRVFFLVEHDDGSLHEVKAIETKTVKIQGAVVGE